MKFTRKENGIIANINPKKGFILKLLNDNVRYIRHKIGSIYRKLTYADKFWRGESLAILAILV